MCRLVSTTRWNYTLMEDQGKYFSLPQCPKTERGGGVDQRRVDWEATLASED